MKCTEETRNNCKSAPHACWHCEGGSQYLAINPNIQSCWHKKRAEERKAERKAKKHTATAQKARRSKKKGSDGEREVVALLGKYGIGAERQLLSGAAGNFNKKWAGDVVVTKPIPFAIEVKRRKNALQAVQNRLYCEDKAEDMVRVGDIVLMPFVAFVTLLQGDELVEPAEEKIPGIITIRNWLNQSEHTPVLFYRSDGDTSKWVVAMWDWFYEKLKGVNNEKVNSSH